MRFSYSSLFAFPLVPPLKVDISKVETRFVAGESSEIRCQTFGSRPAASISWWKDNVRLSDSSYKVSALCTQGFVLRTPCYPKAFVEMLLGLPRQWVSCYPLWPSNHGKIPQLCVCARHYEYYVTILPYSWPIRCETLSEAAHLFRNVNFQWSPTLLRFCEDGEGQRPSPF